VDSTGDQPRTSKVERELLVVRESGRGRRGSLRPVVNSRRCLRAAKSGKDEAEGRDEVGEGEKERRDFADIAPSFSFICTAQTATTATYEQRKWAQIGTGGETVQNEKIRKTR
jgi:hypothetical protein